MEYEDIKKRAIRGIVALTGRTVVLQLVSVVAFFLLGIFLSPSAVGVFIIVSSVMRILSLFTDVGLGAALIQKKEELDSEDLKTAFTLQEILVVFVVLLGFVATPLVANYIKLDSDGIFLYRILVFSLFISSLKVIPSILLERKLAFDKQILPQIVEAIVFNSLVVFLAYKGFGVASYAWAVLCSSLAGLPLYYLLSPWSPSFGIAFQRARKMISYGLAYQGKSVLAVVKDDLLTFFLAGKVSSAGVGYWGWAQRWSYSPFRFIADSVTKVTFPAYARIQHDKELLRVSVEKSLFGVSSLLFPILTAMVAVFPGLIKILPRYEKWEPALISFYFLCATAGISALSNVLVNALDATGRVKTTLGLMVLWIVGTWGLTIFLITRLGFTGIAVAQIFLLAALGFVLVKRRFLGHEGLNAISQLVMDIALPLLMFCQLIDKFDFKLYANWWIFPLLSLAITAIGLAIGWCFKPWIKGHDHKLQFVSLVGFQNSGYLPLALVAALLPGEKLTVMFIYIFLFLIGFNAAIFSLGIHMISFYKNKKFELASLFSPPVIAMGIGLMLVYFGLHKFIPQTLLLPLRLMGDCTLPLAMLVVGGMLAELDIGRMQKGPVALILTLKLIALPLLGLLLIMKLHLPELVALLILIELAMPPATTLSIIVRHYKKEDVLVSQGIFFGHIASIITIPIFLSLYYALVMVK